MFWKTASAVPRYQSRALAAQVRLQQRDAAALPVEVPRPADADVVVQRARPVLREHADAGDAGVDDSCSARSR